MPAAGPSSHPASYWIHGARVVRHAHNQQWHQTFGRVPSFREQGVQLRCTGIVSLTPWAKHVVNAVLGDTRYVQVR